MFIHMVCVYWTSCVYNYFRIECYVFCIAYCTYCFTEVISDSKVNIVIYKFIYLNVLKENNWKYKCFMHIWYTDASYFHGTNCLKYTSIFRMLKLENVHKYYRKNMWIMSYILVKIQWKSESGMQILYAALYWILKKYGYHGNMRRKYTWNMAVNTACRNIWSAEWSSMSQII